MKCILAIGIDRSDISAQRKQQLHNFEAVVFDGDVERRGTRQ